MRIETSRKPWPYEEYIEYLDSIFRWVVKYVYADELHICFELARIGSYTLESEMICKEIYEDYNLYRIKFSLEKKILNREYKIYFEVICKKYIKENKSKEDLNYLSVYWKSILKIDWKEFNYNFYDKMTEDENNIYNTNIFLDNIEKIENYKYWNTNFFDLKYYIKYENWKEVDRNRY